MLDLIDAVLIATDGKDELVDGVLSSLAQMNVSTTTIRYSDIDDACTEPLIICTSNSSNIDEYQQQLVSRNGAYVVVHTNNPERGLFYPASDSESPAAEAQSLSLTDCVYALVQSHIQRQGPQFSANRRLWLSSIIGNSEEFQNMIRLATRIAGIDCDVLIQGETGTGKELIARLIHYESHRQDYPFVPINCGAFSDELLLSELFGHTKGAFTGALKDRVGLIEQAQHGTLFLDEIDSLSNKAQVSLLRYLQDREIRPQGSNTLKTCDTRVVAASNKSLSELVKQGKFREDLLFRLDVLHIDLPPLRERDNDIHLLAQYFMRQAAKKYNLPAKMFSPNLTHTMAAYAWPGNIRQLQNIVYRLFLLSEQFVIRIPTATRLAGVEWENYQSQCRSQGPGNGMQREKQRVIEAFESSYLKNVLSMTSGNISKAARIARKERRSFMRLMKKYDLERKDFVAYSGTK